MNERDGIIALLNESRYIFLSGISEPRGNALRLEVVQAATDVNGPRPEIQVPDPLRALLSDALPIRPIGGCMSFEIVWQRYVAYLVTEELVRNCATHENEVYSGNLFRQYTHSNFLRHLETDTAGHLEPLLHYKLLCENHVIDVASYEPPGLRVIGTVAS